MFQKLISSLVAVSILAPAIAVAADTTGTPYEQDFILTAYYSPLPNQCCYVKGSEIADKELNGNGTHGADGTEVYPGMIAAPASYAFGTRIILPGIGTMTVHDRGGAIQEMDHADRLDVWAGYGEEGLARALAFGVKHIHGTVYPPASKRPEESMNLAALPSPLDQLKPYIVADAGLLDMHPEAGDRGLSVRLLQQYLKDAGVFTAQATGLFGNDTQKALATFQQQYGLNGDGSILDEKTAAYLLVVSSMDAKKQDPVSFIGKESNKSDIQSAQRLMRYLGYYRGRTDGKYSDTLFSSILKYQQEQKLVGDAASPGAGRIGPLTRGKLLTEWRKHQVAARVEQMLAMKRIGDLLAKRGEIVSAFLSVGQHGKSVKSVQEFLAAQGFFEKKKVNGNFGELTKAAVIAYQKDRGLIKTDKETGAGMIGPLTLRTMRTEQVQALYRLVRAEGWGSL